MIVLDRGNVDARPQWEAQDPMQIPGPATPVEGGVAAALGPIHSLPPTMKKRAIGPQPDRSAPLGIRSGPVRGFGPPVEKSLDSFLPGPTRTAWSD